MQKGQGVSTLSFGKIKADSFNIFPVWFCNFHMLFCIAVSTHSFSDNSNMQRKKIDVQVYHH